MKKFIPAILLVFVLQSCGGSNIDSQEDGELEDVNPVIEEEDQEEDDDGDSGLIDLNQYSDEEVPEVDDGGDDRRDDEKEPDNIESDDDEDNEVEEILNYNIGEDANDDPGYGYDFE